MEPFDIADLFPQRTGPIPRATANDELYVIKSNPGHIKWGEPDNSWYGYPASYHIGYRTKFGSVALCGVGNDVIPTGCRCAPWHPKPERTETDCADCLNIARSLHFEGKYPDEVKDVALLLAEVDRLRAELDKTEQNHEKWVKFVRPELDNLRSERDLLKAELKAAKSTRFENNGVGDVSMHIQAETINDLRLN